MPAETLRFQLQKRNFFNLPFLRKLMVDHRAILPVLVLALTLVVLAITAPLISPFDPDKQTLLARLKPPVGFDHATLKYMFGTDQLGRDLLSRCLFGLRLTLMLAFISTLFSLSLGVSMGLIAGMAGGWIDRMIMGIVDVMLSLPTTLIALLVVTLAGTDLSVLIILFSLAYFAQFARLVRAQVLSLKQLPYIEAARAAGASTGRIARIHLIPNIISPVVVMATLNFSNVILLESSLSFLGLGVQPPTATLGAMVGRGRDYLASAPWIALEPAILIVLVSLTIMLLGDYLRDYFDVKLRAR